MTTQLTGNLENRYEFDLTSEDLIYSGKKPESGTLLIDRLQNISVTLKYDKYCIEKKFDESEPTIKDKANCNIDNSEIVSSRMYKERILNGTDPVIDGDLIPVTIDSTGKVYKSSVEENYYSYSNKVWANAVILIDKNQTYEVGVQIPESNIESYFVWIPRYKYQLWHTTNSGTYGVDNPEHAINIVFEDKNTTASNGTSDGEWLTHPAFTSFNSNGMWVGKFETGYKGATSTAGAQQNNSTSTNIIIKPNVYSWRSITVSNAYTASYNYKRTLESHMMKNTEWGAVAYLSHSNYGINGSIRINNNSSLFTGYAATNEPTCGYTTKDGVNTMSICNAWETVIPGTLSPLTREYNTEIGVLASTTGNISGIYDMSGGAWEYVMGYLTTANTKYNPNTDTGKTYFGWTATANNAGFTSKPDDKYFDSYTVAGNMQNRILGDATGEMGPFGTWSYTGIAYNGGATTTGSRTISSWNKDDAYFVNAAAPWFIRGGYYNRGATSGALNFYHLTGGANDYYSFRLVLSPNA